MKIKQVKISEIKPYAKNAKKHSNKQIGQVANSIKEMGFVQPIVVDKNNEIISGHCRYDASKKLGLEEVPVLKVDLPESKVKALRLADNKLNESDWDMGLVIEELKGLNDDDLDLTGFDKDLILGVDDFGEDFTLPSGDKEPFQQQAYILADKQAEFITNAIKDVKQTEEYNYIETFGNENSNGNALYLIVSQWAERRK